MQTYTLYSTDCPKCKVLEAKMRAKNIEFDTVKDIDSIVALGYTSAPILKVDDKCYMFEDAVKLINSIQ